MPIYKINGEKKDGLQKYKVRVNYTDSFGAHKQLTRVAWGKDAAAVLERELTQQAQNRQVTADLTVDQLFAIYFDSVQHEIRRTSLSKKQSAFKYHISPFLGKVNIKKLDVKILNSWKNYINEKDLAFISKKNTYKELNACLNFAVKTEYLATNPLLKVDNFRNAYDEKTRVDFYTPEEFQKYIAAALSCAVTDNYYDYYVFFNIAYFTGARKGEIHALRWTNFDGQYIDIKKSITQKLKQGDIETPPKNKSSIRKVRLPQPLIDILTQHRRRQQSAVKDWNENGFICGYYTPLRDTSIDLQNRKYARMADVKRIRIHDFRHSHASLLINANISPLQVAQRLGHATVDQTLKTYSHLFPNEEERTIQVLNNIFTV